MQLSRGPTGCMIYWGWLGSGWKKMKNYIFSSMEWGGRVYDLVEYPPRHSHEEAEVVAAQTPDHPLRGRTLTSILVLVYLCQYTSTSLLVYQHWQCCLLHTQTIHWGGSLRGMKRSKVLPNGQVEGQRDLNFYIATPPALLQFLILSFTWVS